MKRIAAILKSVTALIYLIPGVAFFSAYAFPVNISKGLLFAFCEIFGAAIILIVAANAAKVYTKIKKSIILFSICCLAFFTVSFISLAYFSASFVSNTYNNEKVLLPLSCKGDLCKLIAIAKSNNEEIGVRLGKDDLIEIINECCKPELLRAIIIYYVLVIAAFSVLILLFTVLSIFYDKNAGKPNNQNSNQKEEDEFEIFLSYASENAAIAEELCYSLRNAGYHIFFDRSNLQAAMEYNLKIKEAITSCHLMIFLISSYSVDKNSYTLTELKFAKEKWPSPQGKVLPVMVEETSFSLIPGYLKSVTVLKPEGNIVAEVLAEVIKITK